VLRNETVSTLINPLVKSSKRREIIGRIDEIIKQSAQTIGDHAGEKLLVLFPNVPLQKASEASETIWENWDRFQILASRMALQAQGLAMAADNPLSGKKPGRSDNRVLASYAAMAPDEIFALLGQTCSDCHKQFRIKK
jgi:cytochrome c556